MKNSLAFAVGGMILITASVVAGSNAAETNRVSISYVPPTNPAHQQVYELLKERQSLEKFQEFFSPFRLQYPLHISATGCEGEADAMYSYDSIRICYESN